MTQAARFRAMGCDVVVGGASDAQGRAIAGLFAERDRIFSRFRPDSELCAVNRSPAPAVRVSAAFAAAVGAALAAARATGGLVDPTLLDALEHSGYDVDFARLRPDPRPCGAPVPSALSAVSLAGPLVVRRPGVRLDLAGVVKAQAVDDGLARLPGEGFVSAGGDVASRGPLEVALPAGGSVRLERGALATSGVVSRHWLRGGARRHHLIDPRTGAPANSPWEQVTVCGATCLAADVAAKAAFLLGDGGPRWLDGRGLPGRFVRADGTVVANAAWSGAIHRATACA